ncbi:DNA-binding protein [Raoultella phage RP180]|uniref:DNA-binding protein n=1 Tax=Raoultella phage RP180 TaxID=2565500 RepID=A0A4D6E029_9CAUD|nr:DNA-binding protein [Raoultella phage RP180]QBZ71299.1 DNA-binding protein [Raoultella phage RP180]
MIRLTYFCIESAVSNFRCKLKPVFNFTVFKVTTHTPNHFTFSLIHASTLLRSNVPGKRRPITLIQQSGNLPLRNQLLIV